MLQDVALVLEGGGMRCAYTSGVLDALMDAKIEFPYVVGVSAGANNGANFVAGQRERNKKIFVDMMADDRYLSLKNFFREGSYFGMNFLFDILPNTLAPFDYNAFEASQVKFSVCVLDCETGEPRYFYKHQFNARDFTNQVIRASCSLPLLSRPVVIKGRRYLDGGMRDSIPLRKSIEDGNRRHVVVLTRNKAYRKKPSVLGTWASLVLSQYPKVAQAMQSRYQYYNATLEEMHILESKGRLFVFRPDTELKVGRYERNVEKLNQLYAQGYHETRQNLPRLREWLE